MQAGQIPLPLQPEMAWKTPEVMERLNNIRLLSPTAINTYMRCQMQFFYSYVAGVKELNEQDEDEIDNRVFGNIFHRAAELMYSMPQLKIDEILNIAFNEQLFHLPEGTMTEPHSTACSSSTVLSSGATSSCSATSTKGWESLRSWPMRPTSV